MIRKTPKLKNSILKVNDKIVSLIFDRDDIRNALTGSDIIEDIEDTIHWINSNHNVSVLIITGNGKAFSAGGNMKEMMSRSGSFAGEVKDIEKKYRDGIQNIPKIINTLEVPIIAAVNGAAIGAGCDLACMCDIRIAGKKASFAESFINLGIIPGDGGAFFLQKLIGYQRAAEMTFTGRTVSSSEALEIGLVFNVVEDANLQQTAMKLAMEIASKPPIALRYSKRLMKMASRMELNDFLDICAVFQGICHNDPEHIKAMIKTFKK